MYDNSNKTAFCRIYYKTDHLGLDVVVPTCRQKQEFNTTNSKALSQAPLPNSPKYNTPHHTHTLTKEREHQL